MAPYGAAGLTTAETYPQAEKGSWPKARATMQCAVALPLLVVQAAAAAAASPHPPHQETWGTGVLAPSPSAN